jgi:E3 ubiquitin-protein ligase HERC2
MRITTSNYKAWNATMLGEGSIDAGGPFRDSLSNITEELYSKHLPLLIPTQNNKNDHGFSRDCWTINPGSKTDTHLEMFKFFGALIGMAFRSGSVLDFKLPPIFWKTLCSEPLTMEDVRGTDAYAVQAIETLIKNKKDYDKETFDMSVDQTFTTQISNGETVDVCKDGSDKKVNYEDVEEYTKLVLKTRYYESEEQMSKIKDGFDVIFPIGLISLLTWREVESRVRGPNEITTADLKSITSYNCPSDSPYVERFWTVFERMSQDERSMFLKFVWGRSRLPPRARMNDQKFQITLIGNVENSDQMFPQSHTCFFQLDLPQYQSDDAAFHKILYASLFCGEIDTDGMGGQVNDPRYQYD